MLEVSNIYKLLHQRYGFLGWWPVFSKRNTSGFNSDGYRLTFPQYPLVDGEKDEIVVGAVLTQNTAWRNVEKALVNLEKSSSLMSTAILSLDQKRLAELIRSSGYHNQKARKLQNVMSFLSKTPFPTRDELLGVWGIGQETADAILLYGYGRKEFVVDAYTRRIFSRLGLITDEIPYAALKRFIENRIDFSVSDYQNFHAVLVEFAKEFCRKKPVCVNCPLKQYCRFC